MPVNTVNIRLKDSESDSKLATVPFYVPTGQTLAEYQDFAEAAAEVVDNVSGSQIMSIDMIMSLTVPTGIKTAPVAASLNERGGILGMDTDGQFNDSVRIPAILLTIMTGDSFSLADTGIVALRNLLVAGDGIVIPKTRDDFDWIGTGLYGKKSFRRK